MIYSCLIKGENIYRERKGILSLMGFIAKVTVEADLPNIVEALAMAKLRQSDFLLELKDQGFNGVSPKLSLIGISKSAAPAIGPIEFTWFPMEEMA